MERENICVRKKNIWGYALRLRKYFRRRWPRIPNEDQRIADQYNFYVLKDWDSMVRVLGLKEEEEKASKLLEEFEKATGSQSISRFKEWLEKKEHEVLEISVSLGVLVNSVKTEVKYDQTIWKCQPKGSDSWN